MNLLEDILNAAVASAAVEFAVGAPALPTASDTDFGADLDLDDDLTPEMRETSGGRALAQAIRRRLSTPRGSVIDAPDYGFDVREMLSKGMTTEELAGVPDQVRAELEKEQRIETLTVKATQPAPGELDLDVRGETATGPFALTLNVTAAAVLLTGAS